MKTPKFIVVLMLTLLSLATTHGAVETLYYDNFDGPPDTDLVGTMPDISTNSALWQAGTWVNTDGTYGGGSSGQMFTAALPFTPIIGAVYELSATVDNSGDWVGIAFLNAAPNVETRINDNAPLLWSLTRQSGASSKDQAFIGPGTGGALGNTTTTSAAELKVRIEMNSDTDWLVSWYFDGSQEFLRTVNPVTDGITINYVAFGSNGLFSACTGTISEFKLVEIPQALQPSPANDSLVFTPDVTLQWQAGIHADGHDLYFGTDFDDVNNATTSDLDLYKGRQSTNNYTLTDLTPGLPYYWRIDEVRADGTTIDKGEVWSFTIQPLTAYTPMPVDNSLFVDTDVELSWSQGSGATIHRIYFGEDYDSVLNATTDSPEYQGVQIGSNTTWTPPGPLTHNHTYYWRVDETSSGTTHKGNVWSFTTLPDISVTDQTLKGWWKFDEGQGSVALDWSGLGNHGTLINGPQWATSGNIDGALQFDGLDDQVSLPVDSVVGALNSSTFAVWVNWDRVGATVQRILDFGTGTDNYMYLSPGNGGGGGTVHFNITSANAGGAQVDSQTGLAAGWHHVAVTIDSENLRMQLYVDGDPNGNPVTTQTLPADLGDTTQNYLGRSQAADYTWFSGFLDDLRIYNRVLTQGEIGRIMEGDLFLAWNPSPADSAITDVEKVQSLSWSAGDTATQHDVYVGTDENAVRFASPGTVDLYQGRQSLTEFNIDPLDSNTVYYWRIDEVEADGTVHEGRLWSFTVADYIIVDNFETYTDNRPNRIFETWRDRYPFTDAQGNEVAQGNGTGMTVGIDEAPFGPERTIVNSGTQSMPLTYDNSASPYYSETDRTFEAAQDWTVRGGRTMNTLSMFVRGRWGSNNGFTLVDSTYTVVGSGADIWNTSDEFHYVYMPLNGDGSITVRIDSIENVDVWAKAGVMIREGLNPDSANVMLDVTPDNLVEFITREFAGVASTSVVTEAGSITLPHWLRLRREGNILTGEHSSDGQNWELVNNNSSILISMSGDVYIGLAVTSRIDAGTTCEGVFSNVQVTGTAGTTFTVSEDIGLPINDAANLYIAIEDATGAVQAVYPHEDNPNAVLVQDWVEWIIPLSAFADQGVDLTQTKKMIIGVGDEQPDGLGKLYIDDIRLHP